MKENEWDERWKNGQIGFHKLDVNKFLVNYWSELNAQSGESVFLPLCGKSLDMVWLNKAGFDVYGSERVEIAVKAFYEEQNRKPGVQNHPTYKHWQAEGVHILEGDYFSLPEGVVNSTLFYDRAALIALPKELRANYVKQLLRVAPEIQQGLLITLEYDQDEAECIPFSVPQQEVEALFSKDFHITVLYRKEEAASPLLEEKGISTLAEVVYKLSRR